MSPRFQGANREHNEALVAQLHGMADAKGASLAQLAIAWVAAQGKDIVPIVGPRRIDQVTTMIDSNNIPLTTEDLTHIDTLIPPNSARGDRYPPQHMPALDSEH